MTLQRRSFEWQEESPPSEEHRTRQQGRRWPGSLRCRRLGRTRSERFFYLKSRRTAGLWERTLHLWRGKKNQQVTVKKSLFFIIFIKLNNIWSQLFTEHCFDRTTSIKQQIDVHMWYPINSRESCSLSACGYPWCMRALMSFPLSSCRKHTSEKIYISADLGWIPTLNDVYSLTE